jgi:chemotaxis protein MotB
MLGFFKTILRLAFIGGVVMLFFTACSAHKSCGDPTAKKKYHGKRYLASLKERDSLCNVAKQRQQEIATLQQEKSGLQSEMAALNSKYEEYQKASGSQLSKLNTDLGSKDAMLKQREARLRDLEALLRRQDSVLNRLNSSVKNALLGFSSDELTVEMKNGKVYVSLSDKLLFKSGAANVENKGKEALKKVADVLNKNQDVSIAIEGHTDNVPVKTSVYKDNWDLSAARATNVVRLLTDEYGMDPKRITASGRGEYSPVADNSTPEGKARNRRTEIVLSPQLEELMKLISKN